jgi:NAD(P)-dependent dehydrogenase (short-subunit alcohol dehydrogenase family)
MRVALVSEHASPLATLGEVDAGGQNVHVAALAQTLARRGAEVVVHTRRDDPDLTARNLGAAARTVGARRASTPYVAFCDDDSWWAPGALERARGHFARAPAMALLAAGIHVGAEERLDPTCAAMAASPLHDDADLPGPPSSGSSPAARSSAATPSSR